MNCVSFCCSFESSVIGVNRLMLTVVTNVITVRTMIQEVKLRKIGNSVGMVLSKDVLTCMRVKEGDSVYLIDTALVSSEFRSKHFVNVLNFGFLADTVELSEKLPKLFRRFRYPISFWVKLLPAKSSQMNLQTHNYEFSSHAFVVSICNGQFFGGGWNISPKSSLQDGLLNIQIFKVTKRKAMKLFFQAKKGLHLTDPDVLLKRSGNIKLLTTQSIEIDGDYFDKGPAEIFVKKHSIQLKI